MYLSVSLQLLDVQMRVFGGSPLPGGVLHVLPAFADEPPQQLTLLAAAKALLFEGKT